MSEEQKAIRVARITMRQQTEAILQSWKIQIRESYPNFAPSDRELVEWAVERCPRLSKRELAQVRDRFFDEVRDFEQILAKLRKAQTDGQNELVKSMLSSLPNSRKKPREKEPQTSVITN